jgi:replication factor C subunit 3/5
MFFNAFSHK